ncbi:MAG: zf-HC2 domain-containing protein [Candidatus Latescibacteria bacterium]|nr:zf-HC2 domain-containing protein [Candidatus Latescibacterota bacterium]
MHHKRAQALFSAAVDGELSARQQGRLAQHLQECAECRQEFALFERVHRLLGIPEKGALSAEFTEQTIQRLRSAAMEAPAGVPDIWALNARLILSTVALLLLFLWGDTLHVLPDLIHQVDFDYRQQVQPWAP